MIFSCTNGHSTCRVLNGEAGVWARAQHNIYSVATACGLPAVSLGDVPGAADSP